MILDVDDSIRPHVAVACRALARQMIRDGAQPPRALLSLADELMARDTQRDTLARKRALAAQRKRRQRARQAAQRSAAASGEVALSLLPGDPGGCRSRCEIGRAHV